MSNLITIQTTTNQQQQLLTELQSHGLKLDTSGTGVSSRKGGAGPSDHRAVTVSGTTVMIPIHTKTSSHSPFSAQPINGTHQALLYRGDKEIGIVSFPPKPKFYDLETSDGIPYWKIAQLHAQDVLATTVLQHCIRYPDVNTRCQFCAIGESLRGGRTIPSKTPLQLAEVTEAAKRLDGITHVVMTTGTPPTPDRGAAVLRDYAMQG